MGTAPAGEVPAVVLISASWAGPSRPAPTVLRELGRRWGATMHVLLVDEPSEELLEEWSIKALPTWLRFQPGSAAGEDIAVDELIVPELVGTDVDGTDVALPGPWTLTHRRTGAQPKHVIDADFGPAR